MGINGRMSHGRAVWSHPGPAISIGIQRPVHALTTRLRNQARYCGPRSSRHGYGRVSRFESRRPRILANSSVTYELNTWFASRNECATDAGIAPSIVTALFRARITVIVSRLVTDVYVCWNAGPSWLSNDVLMIRATCWKPKMFFGSLR